MVCGWGRFEPKNGFSSFGTGLGVPVGLGVKTGCTAEAGLAVVVAALDVVVIFICVITAGLVDPTADMVATVWVMLAGWVAAVGLGVAFVGIFTTGLTTAGACVVATGLVATTVLVATGWDSVDLVFDVVST